MKIDLFQYIYMISYMIGTYILYRYFSLFYDLKKYPKLSSGLFIAYYLIITSVQLFIKIPILLLGTNIICFLAISYIIGRNIKKAILSTSFIYFIHIMMEMLVVMATQNIKLTNGLQETMEYEVYFIILNYFLIHIGNYTLCFIINNYREFRNLASMPWLYWACVILIPCISIYVDLILYHYAVEHNIYVMTGFVLLLASNFAAFYLFESISAMYKEKMEKLVLEQQNIYYNHQLEIFQTSLKSMRSFKHDLTNHLTTINILLNKNEVKEAEKYITQMANMTYLVSEYAKSGNAVIDSIINYKLKQAEEDNIKIHVVLNIPNTLNIQGVDMVIILGNLLDNAIEATKYLSEGRYIDIRLNYNKGRLLIKIENSFDGIILKEGNKVISRSKDNENHGLGIDNVKKCTLKYNGTMDSEIFEYTYITTVLLYVSASSQL